MASVEIYGSGARGTDQFRHRFDCPAAAKHQATAGGGEVITKRRETVMQPPACRTSQTPAAGRLVVEDKGGYERPAAFNRSKERGIVGKPQIPAEPYDDGTVVRNITFAGSFHHSVRDRESPMPRMTQAAKSGRGTSMRAALGSTEILLADAIAGRSHATRAAALGSGRAFRTRRFGRREALRPDTCGRRRRGIRLQHAREEGSHGPSLFGRYGAASCAPAARPASRPSVIAVSNPLPER